MELVVLQPTPFCNIACTYCYLPTRDDRGVMGIETVRAVFERLFASGYAAAEVAVVWHAGEPLVVGPAFYREAFALIEALRPADISVVHSFQTNGMLISDAWCDLFERWDAKIGVSIDGPRAIHDAKRVTRAGRGTFDRTMDGIHALQRRGIPFHALSVLGADSLRDPAGMHAFYADAGIDQVCFNVEESEGDHVSELFAQADLDRAFKSFLESFWRIARAHGAVRFIREIDGMMPRVFRPAGTPMHNPQTTPLSILSVDRVGRVSTFSPELLGYTNPDYADFILGDIHRDTLEEIHAASLRSPLHAAVQAGVRRCERECGYFSVCGGGAPVNKLFEAGGFDATRTGYCRLTQMVPTDIILGAIDRLEASGHRRLATRMEHPMSILRMPGALLLLCCLAHGTPAYSQASQPGPPGPQQDADGPPAIQSHQQPVFAISGIDVTQSGAAMVIKVRGIATTEGWREPTLVPLTRGTPSDGVLDLVMVAEPPPEAMAATGFVPLDATLKVEANHPYRGVRVRAATNVATVAKLPGKVDVAPPTDDCRTCVGRVLGTGPDAIARDALPKGTRILGPTDPFADVSPNPNRLTLLIGDDGKIIEAVWQ